MLRSLIGLLLALAVFEVAIQGYYQFVPVWDPDFGTVPAPGNEVRAHIEGHGVSHWLPGGIRKSARASESVWPSVLVVGDSYTEALQVNDNQCFTAVLEQELFTGDVNLRVLNAGKSGQAISDYVARAQRYLERFEPIWVIVQVTEGQLLRIGATRGNMPQGELTTGTQAATAMRQGLPPWSRGQAFSVLWFLRQHSVSAQFGIYRVNTVVRSVQDDLRHLGGVSLRAPTETSGRTVFDPNAMKESIDLLDKAFSNRLTILCLPSNDLYHLESPSLVEEELVTFCRRKALSLVLPRERLAALLGQGASPFGFPNTSPMSGHLSRLGHREVAAALLDELQSLRAHDVL